MKPGAPTLISVFDLTGTWSQPYVDAGWNVLRFDIQRDPSHDVRLLQADRFAGLDVRGLILQPPCTEFTSAGSRWWQAKGEGPLLAALALVDAGMRLVVTLRPRWWVLENPIGRLRRFIGAPRMIFDPWQFAGWRTELGASVPRTDRYTKRGALGVASRRPRRNQPPRNWKPRAARRGLELDSQAPAVC